MPQLVFHTYFDTSGSQLHPDALTITACGVVSTDRKWEKFDAEWTMVMRDAGITHFHATDFQQGQGEFRKWRGHGEKRREFLNSLVRIAKRHILTAFTNTVILADYDAVARRFDLHGWYGGAYAFGQVNCLRMALAWLMKKKSRTAGAGFHVEKGDNAQHAFRMWCHQRQLHDLITIDGAVSERGEYITPFQVADLIAYEYRKAFDAFHGAGRRRAPLRPQIVALRRMLPIKNAVSNERTIAEVCKAEGVPLIAD